MSLHYIYITKNSMNGKMYIGQRKCPDNLKPWNDSYLGSGMLITKAVKKYGREVFFKKVIAACSTNRLADVLEILYMDIYKVLENKDVWYNRSPGGQYWRAEGHSKAVSQSMKEYYSDREKVDKATSARMGLTVYEYKKHLVKKKRDKINRVIKSIKTREKNRIEREITKQKKKEYLNSSEYLQEKKRKRKLLSEKQKSQEFKDAVRVGKEKARLRNPTLYSRKRSVEENINLARKKLSVRDRMYIHSLLWDNGHTIESLSKNIFHKIKRYIRGYKSEGSLLKYVLVVSEFLNSINIYHDFNLLLKEAYDKRDINRRKK